MNTNFDVLIYMIKNKKSLHEILRLIQLETDVNKKNNDGTTALITAINFA